MNARLSLALAPIALLAACNSGVEETRSDEPAAELPKQRLAVAISPEQYDRLEGEERRAGDLQLIDVRTPEEFAEGHIADATNIDWKSDDFAQRVSQLPKDKKYVLYCRTGHRSGEAREAMAKMGFQNVASMTGGITAWQNGEMPVVK